MAEVRTALSVGTSRNIAIAEGNINGQAVNITAVSGNASRVGTAALPTPTKFTTIATGSNPRTLDAERKILETVASKTDGAAKGSLKIFTERPPCISCQSVGKLFSEAYPGVSLSFSSSVPEGLGIGASLLSSGLAGQAGSYLGSLSGTGGAGFQTLQGISPR